MSELFARWPELLVAHLQLSLAALAIGVALSVPVGIAVSRRRELEGPVLGVAGALQTVPSLALLAFMVPLFAWLGGATTALFGVELSSIGFGPALVALCLYSVLPILRNTVTGLDGVDPALVEAARGVGMTPSQRLRRVELPLALPVVVAGIRTATVWVVGTATLATPVGANSLGNFIFSGLQTRNSEAVLLGSVSAAGLALLLDALIRGVESGLQRSSRWRLAASTSGIAALCLLAVGHTAWSALDGHGRARPVVIGAKTFTEQYVLSEIMAQHVERRTGRGARSVGSLGSTVAFDALVAGEIDAYVDYSGTIWATIMGRSGLPRRRAAVLEEVGRYLEREHGVQVAAALGFENTYALAMRGDDARARGVARISDLQAVAPELEIGGDFEFFQRPEWAAIRDAYGLRFRHRRSMDSALMYGALAEGAVDVISAFSTDGRIASYGLQILEDDRGVIPPYDAVVLVSARLAAEAPAVLEALAELDGRIDAATMQQLNARVDSDGQAPARVASAWLAGSRGRPRD
ncbi:MAG: glycine betaine ABC transporter substrate-binding protein [Myxococcota bacterium]